MAAEPEPLQWSFRMAQQSWTPFVASMRTEAPPGEMPPPEPHVTVERVPEAPADPRIETIAASLRHLAEPGAPVEQRRPEPMPEVSLDQLVEQIRASGRNEKDRLRGADRPAIEWRRPLWAVGGLVLGIGLLGGAAGIVAGGDVQDSVTVAVPAAKPVARSAVPSEQLASSLIEMQPGQPARAESAALRMEDRRPARQPVLRENESPDAAVQTESSATEGDALANDPLAPMPTAAEPIAASLPLPNNVIARTIERIGYSCGEVASAAPAGGQGVFKITCSSGQTYQAAPVGGRYRFRRWNRR